jgi:hypothetical protein
MFLASTPRSLAHPECGYDDEPTLARGADSRGGAGWARPPAADTAGVRASWLLATLQRLHLLPGGSARVPDRVRLARQEFEAALADIPSAAAERAVHDNRRARSLYELWYVRSQVFDAVSMARSQEEAARRLDVLNRHFPTRSARSGFVPL